MRISCPTIFIIHVYSINFLYYTFIEFIILLHIFLVISFAWYKEYMICLIWFAKLPNVLPAFSWARTNCNLWNICLGVNILKLERSKILGHVAKSENLYLKFLLEIFCFQKHQELFLYHQQGYKRKGWGAKRPLLPLFFCNFYKRRN